MPKGFYVKVSPTQNFRAVTNFFVKVTPSSWSSVVDGWVKVSPSSWVPFYSAATEPADPIEILTTFNSSEEIRLQGKNYRWSPSPTTLQYRFKVINKESPSSTYDLTSLTTTSNPSTGSSITVPSSSTYIDVPRSGGNYFQGATNVFQFFVRATTAGGSVVEKSAEYEFRIPAAPVLAIENLTSSSVRLTITAASSADFNATYRYIVYRYDSTAGFVYGVSGGTNGLGAVSATTYSTTRDVTGLVPGRAYTFYVLPITGSTGITPNTHSGYPGVVASINNSVVAADPGPFTTISFTKAYPSSSSQGVIRSSSLSWNASENATRYEIQYQGRDSSSSAWTTVQSFTSSPYETSTSQTKQWGSPIPSGGVEYYPLMRASIRASNPDSSVITYSDGGTASAPVYIEAVGSAPAAPSFGSISSTSSSASIPVTISTNTGSNYLTSTLEFMFRKSNQSYPSTWSTTTITNNAATVSLSNLDGSSTYYVKVRVQNLDELYAENETFFNTGASLIAPTSTSIVSVSRLSDTECRVLVGSSGGGGPYYQMYWINGTTAPTTSSYDAAGISSTVTEDFSFSSGITYYFYIRSSSENLGNTTTGGVATAGTYSNYGPTTGAASYTFQAPTGTVSVSPSSGTAGTTEFTASPSVSASPSANISYSWQYRDQGSLWLAAPGTNTNSTYTPPSNYVSLYGGALRCQITANNGVGTLTTASTSVTVNAPLAKLSTPTGVNASDDRSDGVNVTWNAVSGAAYYGVWYGSAPAYDSNPDFGGPNNPTLITGTSYLDTAIGAGQSRDYYVQAFRTNNPTNTKSDWGGPNSGTRVTVTTYTLTYSANGGSTTPTSQSGVSGATITLAANAGTRSGFSFGGWDIGGVTYSGGGSYTFGSANATATAIWTAVFVTPTWNGTMPGWTSGSNFQRITSGTANYKWGWTNGTFSFSGSTTTNRGWNFNGPNSTQLSAGTARGTSLFRSFTTTNDTYTTVQGSTRPYLVSSLRGDVTYNANPRYGSIQPYIFGTDGNEYGGPWTAGI